MKRFAVPFAALVPMLLLCACAANSDAVAPTSRPALINQPIEQATPDYWYKKPAAASVASADFEKLWDACANTVINDQFEIDRQDQRLGVLTTWPTISKQFFEFWRSDAGTLHEVAQDSLQTIRRTVRFEFRRLPDGSFVANPKVLMEANSHPERRITAQPQFTQAFAAVGETQNRLNDVGQSVASRYWYCLGRDQAMEIELANSVREKLGGSAE